MKRTALFLALAVCAAVIAGCRMQAILAFAPPAAGIVEDAQATAAPTKTTVPILTIAASTTAPVPTPTPTPEATASATAAPTPTASAAPAEPYPVVEAFSSATPDGLTVNLKYKNYYTPTNYFLALKSGSIYAAPDAASKKLRSVAFGARYMADKTVTGPDGALWCHVLWSDKAGEYSGYIKTTQGEVRSFRLASMFERVKALGQTADAPDTAFIVNYKNRNGLPPAFPGADPGTDASGNRREMSAPAYLTPDAASAFRYAPDGLLGKRLTEQNGFTQMYFPSFDETRWVPDAYVSTAADAIPALTEVVVVDRKFQNAAAFEFDGTSWSLISMTFVSTGKTGQYQLPTPLGDFMAQDRQPQFYFYADGTQNIAGYAPWAVRFSGGGYLHGVPVNFQYDELGNQIDPGPGESLYTLGTTPQSHMCVRNYTSYAKFIYDWFKKGSCAVIVFE